MTPEEKIKSLGLEVPTASVPVGHYVPAVRTGNLVFTAGQLPVRSGTLLATGKVSEVVPLDVAQEAARQATLNALAAVRSVVSSLDAVVRIVRVNIFVNSSSGFIEQAKVGNAASELLVQIFGDAGRHSRCTVGTSELPLNAPLELDLVAEVR